MASRIECPVCKASDTRSLGDKNRIPIVACNGCTHVFADLPGHDFDHEDLDVFREGFTHGLMRTDVDYYDHLKQGEFPGFPTHITATKVLEMVREAGFEKGMWLDIGSGSGHLVERAQRQGFDVTGIEPGGWGQIAAKRKNITIKQGFLSENTDGLKYSVVSATDVVEHVPDPAQFLRLISTYLDDGGILILSVPCYESFDAKVLGLKWPMLAPPTHRHFFTRKSLSMTVAQSGMRPLKMQQFNIRHLLGLSRYRVVREVMDKLMHGDQLACMMTLEDRAQ
jgi:2-polyprenyl-3-methyl-5-hydroxy-6-metoxy-1,4-benzoquinol methylase